jgi:putative nucleotidyltransferase with HDIG domain
LNIVAEQVVAQLGVDAASVLLLESATHTLKFAAGRGFRTGGIEHSHPRLGDGQVGHTVLERRTLTFPELLNASIPFDRAALLLQEGFVSHHVTPLLVKGQVRGVLEVFHRSRLDPDLEWLEFFEMLAQQTAIAIDNAQLFESLQRSNAELSLAYDATIEGWSHALDLRDKETDGHSLRVTELTEQLAQAMGINDSELINIRRGALLHDIGKMGVPDHILLKPDALTQEEWAIMRRHPQLAYDMLFPIAYLRPALDIPYCHHEKWDGSGYPRGLKGEQIPLAARIFAIVDVWDALCSHRPYRKAWPPDKAIEHIRSLAGTHFDPQVVEVFLRIVNAK